jgi:hypothetical protein
MGGERGTLVPKHYKLEPVTTKHMVIASMALGFTMGIGWLTAWTAIKQTTSSYRRIRWGILRNKYVIMIWGELAASAGFAILSILYLFGVIRPRLELRLFKAFCFHFADIPGESLEFYFFIGRCIVVPSLSL